MKNIFLLSFLPAIAYWYLEANYPLHIALVGGMGLAVLELLLEWVFTKHLHTLSKFNFFLLIFLGALSLLGDEGIWFKLQPAFSGLGMAAFLLFRQWKGEGLLVEMSQMMDENKRAPKELMILLEKHMTIFLGLYGLWMGIVAIYFSSDYWIFFKTAGFYLIFAVFFIFELIYMRIKVRELRKRYYHQVIHSQTRVMNLSEEQYGPRSQAQEEN